MNLRESVEVIAAALFFSVGFLAGVLWLSSHAG